MAEHMARLRVLVIGGGFSGLSAAITLARTGAAIDLIERSPEWAADGAGISIGSASLRALAALGVIERFLEEGYGADGTDLRAPDGSPIAHLPTPRLVSPEIPGNGAIMRPALSRILVDAMTDAGARARLGTTAVEAVDDGSGVDVVFSDGSASRYDLVVAADGVYSATRQRLFPDAPAPRFSGQGAWRAVVPRPEEITNTTVWVGIDEAKVGVNPISHDAMYLFVNETKAANDRVPDSELLDRVRALTAPFTDPLLQRARAALDEDSLVLYRPMENLLVPLPWHRGRTVLIGDAVHATTPHLASGAGIGIEDAIVLAEELRAASDVESALTAFQTRRWERCRMVVESSERLGVLEATPGAGREFAELQGACYAALARPI